MSFSDPESWYALLDIVYPDTPPRSGSVPLRRQHDSEAERGWLWLTLPSETDVAGATWLLKKPSPTRLGLIGLCYPP